MAEPQKEPMLDFETMQYILKSTPGELVIIGTDYDIIYTNLKPKEDILGEKSLIGEKYYRHCSYLQSGISDFYAKKVFETGTPVMGIQIQLKSGKWLEVNSIPLHDPDGNITMVAEFMKDITAIKESSQGSAIADSDPPREQGSRVVDEASWIWNIQTNEMIFSDEFFRMLGYEPGSHAGSFQTYTKLVHPEDIGQVMKSLQYCMSKKTPSFKREYRMLCATGQYKWVYGKGQAEWNAEGKAIRMKGTHLDLSERKLKEEQERYETLRDPLTELYNRALFDDTLQRINAKRLHPLSIFMVEVTGLKQCESLFGQLAAEKQLTRTAHLLRSIFRQEDVLARWDHQTFAIVLPKTSATYAERIDKRIVNGSVNTGEGVLQPQLSVGYATKETLEEDLAKTVHQARDKMMKRRSEQS